MKKKKITFSEPNCRFGCPHFKSVGSVLNETCYCMKKGKKGRRLGKKDLKRRPPEWCPRRLKTPVCRIYGFKDEMHEALELDNRLNFEPDKHDWYFPSSHHYQLQSEFPLGMTAEQFYNALQEEPVESVLNGTPLKNGELIEIDDGLASHFFYCYSQSTLLDPMSGSGTSQAAAQSLGVRSLLYDLNPAPACGIGGWDALRDEVDDSADLIFLHPPYHNLIPYSGNMWGTPHKDDLSRCSSYPEFVEKLNYIVQKLFMALRRDGRLAILVGDIRTKGSFYSMQHDLMRVGQMEAFIVKGQYNCVSDTRSYKKPFIPVVTEYLLLFHKQDALFFPFAVRRETTVDLRKEDIPGLTWHHLIRLTMEELSGRAKLSDLGDRLAAHPKAKKNPHFRDRIRATAYEHPGQYISCGNGFYALNYAVA